MVIKKNYLDQTQKKQKEVNELYEQYKDKIKSCNV